MPMVQDILNKKGSHVHTIAEETTVLDATILMNAQKIGALVVADANGRVAGMFTERDVLRRVVACELAPADVRVGDVMTREVACCAPDADIDDASRIMRDRRVRHLPVCAPDGGLLGLISIGDLNALHASETEQHLAYLSEYVYGRA